MSDLREAAEDLLEGVEAAIKAGDWKIDGACDPDSAIHRLRQELAQHKKITTELDSFAKMYLPNIKNKKINKKQILVLANAAGIRKKNSTYGVSYDDLCRFAKLVNQREWVGLTDEELQDIAKNFSAFMTFDFARTVEAKLKEKNT